MKYRIQNARFGFANNSSSSHSIVLLPPKARPIDSNGDEFGWDWFLLVDSEDKKRYFATQMVSALQDSLGTQVAEIVARDTFGITVGSSAYVDHQSVFVMHKNIDGTPAIDFFKEMGLSVINNPKVGVQGGNDNSDPDEEGRLPSYLSGDRRNPFGNETSKTGIVRREKDGTWILFNPSDGTRVRFSPDFVALTNRKSDTPELVDVKITDFCDIGCSFCYQDSTEKGKHASMSNVHSMLYELSRLKVFEVVYGGGEPTMHPNFVDILKATRNSRMVPNFTTRNHEWIKDKKIVDAVLENCGSFAFSITTAEDVAKLAAALKPLGDSYWNNPLMQKANIQLIAGVTSGEEFKKVVKAIDDNNLERKITILGYKTNGRGGKFKQIALTPKDIREAFENDYQWDRISVDTAFLRQYPEMSQQKTCDAIEGTHSMYIDLVNLTVQESSYTGSPVKLKVEKRMPRSEDYIHFSGIQTAFESFQGHRVTHQVVKA